MTTTRPNFPFWLRRQIELRDMNQSEFAKRAGVTAGVASQWATGRRRPTVESAKTIADALDTDISEVLAALGVAAIPAEDSPEVRRVIDLVRRVKLTADREAGLVALLESWRAADERRKGATRSVTTSA